MDVSFAEFVGIYIGDGCLTIRKEKHSYEFKIVGNPKTQNLYFKNHVAKLISHIIGRRVVARAMDAGRTVGVYFCSKKLAKRFNSLGFPGGLKVERISIPGCILGSRAARRACIMGIFDTDGCFTLKKRGKSAPHYPTITFSMKNRAVIRQIHHALGVERIPHSTCFDLASFDRRNGKSYSKHQISIYGKANTDLWFNLFGSRNPMTLAKYRRACARYSLKKSPIFSCARPNPSVARLA